MRRLKQFTLIELLVVVTIIGILASLLLPALNRAHYQAKIAVCMSNQKQIYSGMSIYTADHDAWYPCDKEWTNKYNGETSTLRSDMIYFQDDWGKPGWNIAPIIKPYFPGMQLNFISRQDHSIANRDIFTCPLTPGPRRYNISSYALFFNCDARASGYKSSRMIGRADERIGVMRKAGNLWEFTKTGQRFSLFMADFTRPVGPGGIGRRTNHPEFSTYYPSNYGSTSTVNPGTRYFYCNPVYAEVSSGVYTGIDGASEKYEIPAGNGQGSTEFLTNAKGFWGPAHGWGLGTNQIIPLDYEE